MVLHRPIEPAVYSVEKLVNVQLLLQSQGEAGTEYAAA